MPSLTDLLLAVALIGLAVASPTYGYDEQKPQHENHRHGTAGCGISHSEIDQLKTVSVGTHDGDREFSIYLPASYDKHKATPVIISFHGRDMNSGEHALMTHLNDSSVNPDMIAIFPQAVDCLWEGLPHAERVTDLQFTMAMTVYMRENYCIDNDRLYASGFDIGGGFVDKLACSEQWDMNIAAFAMVSPALYAENKHLRCKPSRPHPILEIHGADDEVNCYDGGETEGEAGFVPYPSVPDFLQKWAERDGCNMTPDTCTKYGGWVNSTSYNCQGMEGFVQGIKIGGQKHGWPSTEGNKGDEIAAINGSKKIIEFFMGHCKGHHKEHV